MALDDVPYFLPTDIFFVIAWGLLLSSTLGAIPRQPRSCIPGYGVAARGNVSVFDSVLMKDYCPYFSFPSLKTIMLPTPSLRIWQKPACIGEVL